MNSSLRWVNHSGTIDDGPSTIADLLIAVGHEGLAMVHGLWSIVYFASPIHASTSTSTGSEISRSSAVLTTSQRPAVVVPIRRT